MGNFKDFDLDLKVNKGDGKQVNPLGFSDLICIISEFACASLKVNCETTELMSCGPTCECISPSDMSACSACRQMPQGENDIVPYC